MSRLKREGNPPSNQLASPVPQAWDPSINDFREITGQNLGGGRFGADGVQWGKTASGLFVPVRVTNDGVQEVQVSGATPVLLKRYDIPEGGPDRYYGADGPHTFNTVTPLLVHNYERCDVFVHNQRSGNIRVQLYFWRNGERSSINMKSAGEFISVPAGSRLTLSPLNVPEMDKIIYYGLVLLVLQDGAPGGDIVVEFWGR